MDDTESWMNKSIRIHLANMSSRQADTDDGLAVAILSPPVDDGSTTSDSSQSNGCRVQREQNVDEVPVVVAEVVHNPRGEEVATNNVTIDNPPPSGNNDDDRITSSNLAQLHPTKRVRVRKGIKKRRGRHSSMSDFVVTRTSLPYSIEHNEMTMEWVAMINTNQKAIDEGDTDKVEDHLATQVFKTAQEARAFCHCYAPPRMHSLEDSPKCQICKRKFNKFLRRPSQCKNCGICVCSACSVEWSSTMLPSTFHTTEKRCKKHVKVCTACDWLNCTFRQQVLTGNLDRACALYATGNVNVRSPFAKSRGEVMYPVHCAVLSGNLALFKWLVDTLHCPINTNKRKLLVPPTGPLAPLINEQVITLKGKSVLDIAMEAQELGILYFLIIEKRVNIMRFKNLNVALRTLEATLRHLPERLRSTA